AVAPENLSVLQELCDTIDTELTDIGMFTGLGRLVVRYNDRIVLDLDNEFLHESIPQRQLKAVIEQPKTDSRISSNKLSDINPNETLIKLLSHPNIASKASVIRVYDHEVQVGT